jgi:DNA-binding TFAR19-related protein (PDSD5 family)
MESADEDAEKGRLMDAKRAEAQLKSSLRMTLEEDAYARMMNISHANKELFVGAAKALIGLYRRAGRKLKDEEVVRVLMAIRKENEQKTNITFHRK